MMRRHLFYRGKSLDRDLRTLYEDKGKLPDMSRLEHEYHRRTTRILLSMIGILVLLTGASWAGFLVFGSQNQNNVETRLSFDAPQVVMSGVPLEINLRYRNQDKNPLSSVRISLRPPQGLIIQEAEPASDESGRFQWNLGTLSAREEGNIKLTLIPYGILGDKIALQAVMTYKPANFNAEFQTVASHDIEIRDSSLQASFSGPSELTPGQEASFVLNYENRSDAVLRNLRIIPQFPAAFNIASGSEPQEGFWKIDSLPAGARGTLEVRGSFLSTSPRSAELKVRFEVGENNETMPLFETATPVNIAGGNLLVEMSVNNNPDLRFVRLGETLNFKLKLTNLANEPQQDVFTELALRSSLLDWRGALGESADISTEANTIRLPKEGKRSIEAGKVAEQDFSIKVVPSTTPTAQPTIEAEAKVMVGDVVLRSNKLKIFIVSDLAVSAEGRYFGADGVALGAGPLPPRVGEETRYELRFTLTNSVHDLSNLAVIATLPPGVEWLNQTRVDAGRIAFIADNREVRWTISRMPVTTTILTAAFKISVRPGPDKRGSLLPLLSVTRAEALDSIVQVTFSTDALGVYSSIETDPLGKGKGIVQ